MSDFLGPAHTKGLEKYMRLISRDDGGSDEALVLRRVLDEQSPRDPELDKADVEIKRRKLMKKLGKQVVSQDVV